jgi:hypothetical protein
MPSPNRCRSRPAMGYAGWHTSMEFHRIRQPGLGAESSCRADGSVSTPRMSRARPATCRRAHRSCQMHASNPFSTRRNSFRPRPLSQVGRRETSPSSGVRRAIGSLGLVKPVVRCWPTAPGTGGGARRGWDNPLWIGALRFVAAGGGGRNGHRSPAEAQS